MTSPTSFQTARLSARRIEADDFEQLCQMHRNPHVMATLGGVRSDDETRQMLAAYLDHWQHYGFGLWMFFLETLSPGGRGWGEGGVIATGKFVGRGGVRQIMIEGHDEVEVAYALLPEFWNQGLATEIATASVQIAFTQLNLPELVCFTLPTNLASRRVMEKCGFQYDRDFIWKELPHVLYRLKKSRKSYSNR